MPPNPTFDIAAFDAVVGNAPVEAVFRGLSAYYNRLAEQLRELTLANNASGVSGRRFVKSDPDQRRATIKNGSVSKRLLRLYALEDVELARDHCQAVVVGLSERSDANERESLDLMAKLTASLKPKGSE